MFSLLPDRLRLLFDHAIRCLDEVYMEGFCLIFALLLDVFVGNAPASYLLLL